MATNASEDKDVIYLPIAQGESARQRSSQNLLARQVYEEVTELLKGNLRKLRDANDSIDFNQLRAHETIFLGGGRGTGKSTFLVNLPLYIEENTSLSNCLLILDPVDPTLLEQDDDPLLNIIVAAILRDKRVNEALKEGGDSAKVFYEQLQRLGTALEGAQKQKTEFGLEKLRAFIGNNSIAEELHKLFAEVLKLTKRELIVLPIDDVDTSLSNAFKNLEVVRRYLASAYVVPIISGDKELFHEVIWRNLYHGLTEKCKECPNDALRIAKELASEYERKLMPVARKFRMPDLEYFFSDAKFRLFSSEEMISLRDSRNWLAYLHNFHLNGFESSRVEIQMPSLRAYVQLVNATKNQFIKLNDYLWKISPEKSGYMRFISLSETNNLISSEFKNLIDNSIISLAEVYRNGEYGAEISMIYAANKYWLTSGDIRDNAPPDRPVSIFDTPLFQPLSLENQKSLGEDNGAILREEWKSHLHDRVGSPVWLENLPSKTVFSYPKPDKGLDFNLVFDSVNDRCKALWKLMLQERIYSNDNYRALAFVGGIFEILTMSMLPQVEITEFYKILNKYPFHSVVSYSGTKPINVDQMESVESNSGEVSIDNKNAEYEKFSKNSGISDLFTKIDEWRMSSSLVGERMNALLAYRVMNKFYTQLAIAHDELQIECTEGKFNKFKSYSSEQKLASFGLKAFNSYVAALGSFEYFQTLGLSNFNGFLVEGDFEKSELFRANVLPFLLEKDGGGYHVRPRVAGWTGALYLHPLRDFFLSIINND